MSKNSERDAIISHLVEMIKSARLRKKLSLNEVAARSGLSHTMVMRVEKRERLPTIDSLLRITDALEIELAPLISKAVKMVRKSPK